MDAFLLNSPNNGQNSKERAFFNDVNWHRIILKRTSHAFIALVDGQNTSYKLCDRLAKADFRKQSLLYASYLPATEWRHPKWSLGRYSWIFQRNMLVM